MRYTKDTSIHTILEDAKNSRTTTTFPQNWENEYLHNASLIKEYAQLLQEAPSPTAVLALSRVAHDNLNLKIFYGTSFSQLQNLRLCGFADDEMFYVISDVFVEPIGREDGYWVLGTDKFFKNLTLHEVEHSEQAEIQSLLALKAAVAKELEIFDSFQLLHPNYHHKRLAETLADLKREIGQKATHYSMRAARSYLNDYYGYTRRRA